MKIGIVTDSSADIPKNIAADYKITIVPMYVGYDGVLYREGREITTDKVFNALEHGKKVNTSAPSVGDFIKTFKKLLEVNKNDVVCYIGLSSKLSGSINSALTASKSFPENKIEIFDSKTSTINLGFITIEAAKAAIKGTTLGKIDRLINRLIEDSSFTAFLESMEYVFKGGRAAFLGKFLSSAIIFTPILTIGSSGKVKLQKFARNLDTAVLELFKRTKADALKLFKSGYSKINIGIFYGRAKKRAQDIKQMISKDKELSAISDNVIITEITTIISAHTGPGICGVAICPVLY